jgi:hypothetical protein
MRSLVLCLALALPLLAQAQPRSEAAMCRPASAASGAKAEAPVVPDVGASGRARAAPAGESAKRRAPAAGPQKDAGQTPGRAPIGLCDGS